MNRRTAKIGLLALINQRQPVESFDITGDFDFHERVLLLEELRQDAIANRPDMKSAAGAIDKAHTDYRLAWANGSTDPIGGLEYQRTGPDNTLGLNVSIPLRIFDRTRVKRRARHSRSAVPSSFAKAWLPESTVTSIPLTPLSRA